MEKNTTDLFHFWRASLPTHGKSKQLKTSSWEMSKTIKHRVGGQERLQWQRALSERGNFQKNLPDWGKTQGRICFFFPFQRNWYTTTSACVKNPLNWKRINPTFEFSINFLMEYMQSAQFLFSTTQRQTVNSEGKCAIN